MKLGDSINFYELFRVKGCQGLFTLASKENGSGMIRMMEFMRSKKVTVNRDRLVCLDSIKFETYAGHKDLRMADIFNNLNKTDLPSLENIFPNYDEDKVKDYHLGMVIMWYNELTKKLKEISDEKK